MLENAPGSGVLINDPAVLARQNCASMKAGETDAGEVDRNMFEFARK